MRSSSGRPRLAAALAALILVTGMGAATAATAHRLWGTDSKGRIHGCVSKKTGVLRVASTCAKSERALLWNQQGPVGTPGQPGVVGSVDQLDGTPCNSGGGTLDVTYGADGKVAMTCAYAGTVSVTKVGSDLPSVDTDSGLSCAPGQHSCTGASVPTGRDVTFMATLPSSWGIARFAPADVVPAWSSCDQQSHDYTGIWTSTCTKAAPADVEVSFAPFKTWYSTAMSAVATPLEHQVEQCAHNAGTLVVCNSGMNGIDPMLLPSSGPVASATVSNGTVTVTTVAPATTFIRVPTLQAGGTVDWTTMGSCAPADLC